MTANSWLFAHFYDPDYTNKRIPYTYFIVSHIINNVSVAIFVPFSKFPAEFFKTHPKQTLKMFAAAQRLSLFKF